MKKVSAWSNYFAGDFYCRKLLPINDRSICEISSIYFGNIPLYEYWFYQLESENWLKLGQNENLYRCIIASDLFLINKGYYIEKPFIIEDRYG